MSLTTRKLMVEVEEKTWKCDFCDFQLVTRSVGFGRGMTHCTVCRKDCCGKHAKWYAENSDSDYSDARICPDCDPQFSEAWEWAKQNAGRYEDFMEVVNRRLQESRT